MVNRGMIPVFLALAAVGACTLQVPSIFPSGTPFIVKGTSETRDVFACGPSAVWVDTSGVAYHLFQGDRISNEDFDRITTPGVTSRLEIATRDDLQVACPVGIIVEVRSILE
jgi:hypothetical protein